MKTSVASRLLVGTSLFWPAILLAQATPAPTPPAATAPAATPAPAEAADPTPAEIVVTGSRIGRAGFEAPTPVTVLSADSLAQKAPTSLPDALTQLPQFQAGISAAQERVTGSGRVRGGNYLNLRALGPQRVLVLQDGNRLTPTGNNGGTDANLIPQMLVDRIDVVTGGASAAYGSDAVSGVVNFVINDRLKGLKLLAQGGISSRGDNKNYRVGAAYGTSFADDRLHVVLSAEHFSSEGINQRSDRKSANKLITLTGAGTAASPYSYVANTHYSTTAYGGYINNGPLAGRQFLANGQTGTFVAGPSTGRAGLSIGGDGAFFDPACCTLIAKVRTYQTFGRVTYDVADDTKIFVQGAYNYGKNFDHPIPDFKLGSAITVFRDNAYLNQNLTAAELATLGTTPSFTIARLFTEWGPGKILQRAKSFDGRIGIEGSLGDSGIKYDASYSYGRSNFFASALEGDNRRFFAAADAVRNAAGNIVCRITVTNPGLMDDCVPLNTMGVGTASAAAIAYVRRQSEWTAINKMQVANFNVSAEPFSTWAGPVSIAVGGEYRRQSLHQTSNSDPAVPVNFTGIRGVPAGTPQFFLNNVGIASGRYTVKEAYGEIVVPLAKDSVIGRSLELNGAVRYTDYSTSGTVTTWKAGLTYEPIEPIRLRGTVSEDIRAPTLFELFSGQTFRLVPLSDPLTNTFGTLPVVSGGNPNLQPERARTYTAGIVLKPPFIPGLQASVDFYSIKIDDAIATPFQAFQLLDLCAASGYTSPLCASIERPLGVSNPAAANFPTRIFINNINVSTFKTRGLDLELSYRRRLGEGNFTFRALGTRLLKFSSRPSPSSAEINYVGNADFQDTGANSYPLPKWRANFEVGYTLGGFAVSVQERLLGKVDRSKLQVYTDQKIPTIVYTDLTLSYDLEKTALGDAQVFLTVNNLTDTKPPLFSVSNSPGLAVPTLRSAYDIIGTQFTLGVKLKI
ncbi:TonB-dependent receptor [Sphingomonas naphthae]|uniref:TonB-dependent receptor n=1 Tax=Sphingomonas naphthae TaxID=1813468 RepID=A0ABY7TN19_9SPHN|nr:TonB-dependent receptor [Sphingomonas naphthae]WCT74141.1 TonB-dependent receptor [Sphingomonas naphthae]